MNPTNQHIVVYRSQWEADRDQFYRDNPGFILGAVGLLFLLGIGAFIAQEVQASRWRKRFKFPRGF